MCQYPENKLDSNMNTLRFNFDVPNFAHRIADMKVVNNPIKQFEF